MSNIIVKHGNKVKVCEKFTLYEMDLDNDNKYFMCFPNGEFDNYKMIVDFPEVYYDSLLKDDLVSKISDTYYSLNTDNYIYLLTNITTYDLAETQKDNDYRAYHMLVDKLKSYTSSTYNALRENEDFKLDNTIDLMIQTEQDKKLMDWLDLTMPGYFNGIDYSKLNNNTYAYDIPINSHVNLEKPKVRKKVKFNSKGFLSMTFIVVVSVMAILFGAILGLIISK